MSGSPCAPWAAPGRLEIEVTESVFLDLDSQIGQTLRSLTDLG
jgi:EAL domain-containing protein (putative c-di-GMP-specific phosphodiesterase class I)